MPAGSLTTVSPSQVVAYRRCPRVWYNQSVLYDRAPSKGFQLKGDAIHKALEHYMITGEVLPEVTLPDPSDDNKPKTFNVLEFVQVASQHLPPPITNKEFWAEHQKADGGLMVEQAGELPTYEGGPNFVQFIDLVIAYAKEAINNDYKTTSDFRYCKTPAELAKDVQLCSNAKWLFSVSDYEKITLQHLYLQTKNVHPKAKPVSVEITRPEVEEVWQGVLGTIREMQAWAEMRPATADPLPPNTDHCNDYGGCYYKEKCFGSGAAAPQLFNIRGKGSVTMSTQAESATPGKGTLLEKLMAGATKKPDAAPAQAPAAAPATSAPAIFTKAGSLGAPVITSPTPPTPAVVGAVSPAGAVPALFAKSGAGAPPVGVLSIAPQAVAAAAPPAVPAGLAIFGKSVVQAPAVTGESPDGITPPDAPSPVSTPEEIAAANAAEKTEEPAATTATQDAPEPASAATPAPKRRGRPPKTQPAETQAPAVAPVPAVAPSPAAQLAAEMAAGTAVFVSPTPAEVAAVQGPASDVQGPQPPPVDQALENIKAQLYTPDGAFECGVKALFIDCLPAKGWTGPAPVDLNELLHAFERAAASSAKALDYRLIKYESAGWLALGIKVHLKGLPEAIYVDSRTPGAAIFESVVIPYVKLVVRGTR